jgi:GT2 family glycosyltransferase
MTTDLIGPPVHVIVLNYNGSDQLSSCLRSICATDYPNLTVLVVDNASSDGSLALASNYPVLTLRSESNLGWSGGNNLGILEALRAGARYIALANNDIRVHPRWIVEAVAVAESLPDVAVIGFDVHEPQPSDENRDAGFSEACHLWSSTTTSLAEYVGGMAMFVRSAVVEELGLIDENFFAYGEENDFQIRVRSAGYEVAAINVPVWHHGFASFSKIPFRASVLQTENNIQLLLKHRVPLALLRSGLRHIYRRCLSKPDVASTAVERRLGSTSLLQNLVVLFLAAGHILLKSPAIFRRRAEDRRLIAAVQAKRGMVKVARGGTGSSA